MRINIATGPWLPVPAIQGGSVNRLWHGLAEQFASRGHQVTVICRSYPGQADQETVNGVTYIRRGGMSQSTNIYWDLFKDLGYALQTFPKLPPADILVLNDFWLPVFAPLNSRAGQIVVNANRFPKNQYWLYRKVARIAAASGAIRDAIAQQYPPAIPRLCVFPNPINTQVFSPAATPRSQKTEKVILYVGRLHPEKGVHLLLEAFGMLASQFSQVKLKILGPKQQSQGGGGEAYFSKLKAQAQGLNVEFCDPIFDAVKLAEVYRSADLFCYPSLAEKGEAMPVAPLEAMATGLVPVVSHLDCFRDYIKAGETGYFFDHRSPEATKELAKTFASALSDWEKVLQMRTQAITTAKSFSYEAIAERYLDDFERLIQSKGECCEVAK